jgi:uncharacterized protein
MKKSRAAAPTAAALTDKELDRWLQAPCSGGRLTANLAMLDGFLTAMAAGPLDQDLIGALLAALGLGHADIARAGTPAYAAIKAAQDRFNRISSELADGIARPAHRKRGNGEVWPYDWCEGFLAYVTLTRAAWDTVMTLDNPLHGLMLPILLYCKDDSGEPMLGPVRPGPEGKAFIRDTWNDIPQSVLAIRHHYHFIPTGQSRRR